MILRSVRLHPFAGVIDNTVEFSPGMNVVLGPNEAAKSTLVRALLTVLFQPTKYGKVHWNKELAQFVPHGGGDTFRVSLECDSQGGSYQLIRSWGADVRSELTLPSGQAVTASETVDVQVADLLTLKRGTWQNVLIATQAALPNTLAEIKPTGEEAADLAQLLRQSSLNTDGVSIEALERTIQQRLNGVASKWDRSIGGPEKGRGLENRWRKQVGTLLEAWYEHEDIIAQREIVEHYERDLDATTASVNRLTLEDEDISKFVDKYQPAVNAASERQTLEMQREKAQADETKLKDIQRLWPKKETELEQLTDSLPKLEKKLETIALEMTAAEKFEASREQRTLLERALREKGDLTELETTRDGLPKITIEEYDALESLCRKRKGLTTSLAAGQLQLRVKAKEFLEFEVQAGLEETAVKELAVDQEFELTADGRIVLTNPHWTIEVQSGDGGFDTIKNSCDATDKEIKKRLFELNVPDLDAAKKIHLKFKDSDGTVMRQRDKLSNILNGKTLKTLEKEVGPELPVPKRSIKKIREEQFEVKNEKRDAERDRDEIAKRIDEWSEVHKSQDELLDEILEARNAKKKAAEHLDGLPRIPDEIEDITSFKQDFEDKKSQRQKIRESLLPSEGVKRATLEANEPKLTLQEIDERILDAKAKLDLEEGRLRALQRLNDVFVQLKSELDSGTLDRWTSSLQQHVQDLTGERYSDFDVGNGNAELSPGIALPHELLSMGTKSCLGLALRLSMATHFLEGLPGFLVLDDPMVDLDPERQRFAASVLKKFASEKQVIVFTCHPGHAELLTDAPVELQRL